jgi:hypothetical protein
MDVKVQLELGMSPLRCHRLARAEHARAGPGSACYNSPARVSCVGRPSPTTRCPGEELRRTGRGRETALGAFVHKPSDHAPRHTLQLSRHGAEQPARWTGVERVACIWSTGGGGAATAERWAKEEDGRKERRRRPGGQGV